MGTADITRIHERLDAIVDDLSDVKGKVNTLCATSQYCRKIVMGNGKESVDARLTTLETTKAISGKGFWAGVALVSTIVAGMATLAATFVMHMMQGN